MHTPVRCLRAARHGTARKQSRAGSQGWVVGCGPSARRIRLHASVAGDDDAQDVGQRHSGRRDRVPRTSLALQGGVGGSRCGAACRERSTRQIEPLARAPAPTIVEQKELAARVQPSSSRWIERCWSSIRTRPSRRPATRSERARDGGADVPGDLCDRPGGLGTRYAKRDRQLLRGSCASPRPHVSRQPRLAIELDADGRVERTSWARVPATRDSRRSARADRASTLYRERIART